MSSPVHEACVPAPLLLRLPGPLIALVLHCLPLAQKLTECSRLCRSFPRLESAHFVCDAVDLQPRLTAALAASPGLVDLLSGVQCIFVQDTNRTALLRQPAGQHEPRVNVTRRMPLFPRASRVALTGMIERAPFGMLRALLVPQPPDAADRLSLSAPLPAVRLPLLHTVRLSVIEQLGDRMEHGAASLQPLALLPLLRTLVIDELEGGMDCSGFQFVCSLKLEHLDLHGVHITPTTPENVAALMAAAAAAGDVRESGDKRMRGVTDTWIVLRLPTFDPAVFLTDVMLDAVLEHYIGRDEAAAGGLRYISLETPQPAAAFARLAAVRTLRSLDVRLQPRHGVPSDSGALPVDALLSHRSLPALTHLRHLRIRNILPAGNGQPTGSSSEQRVTSSLPYIRLLTAYSQQLRVLSLSRLYPWDSRTAFVEALGLCSQLRVFEFTASVGMRTDECDPPPLNLQQLPTLPHLHTMRLRMPIHPLDVLMMVRACSATLEDYRQTGPFPLPLDVVRWMGSQCRRLRRLECPIEAQDATSAALASLAASPLAPSLAPSAHSHTRFEPMFSSLVSLTVHAERWRLPAWPQTPGAAASATSAASALSSLHNPSGDRSSPVTPREPEHKSDDSSAGSDGACTLRLSDRTVRELAAIVQHAPIRYLDAAGVPLLSVHHFAPLTQLRALRCQQSHLHDTNQLSAVYVPTSNILPPALHPYFIPHPTPTPQPATAHQAATLLLTADLIRDELPVADWQLADEARGAGGWECQWFVVRRVFGQAGGPRMDGREAFMRAVAESAEGAGLGGRQGAGPGAGRVEEEEKLPGGKRGRDAGSDDEADIAPKHLALRLNQR